MSMTIISLATGKFVAWPDKSWFHNHLGYILYSKGVRGFVCLRLLGDKEDGIVGWYSLNNELYKKDLEVIAKTLKSISWPEYQELWKGYMDDEKLLKEDFEFFTRYLPSLALRYKRGIKFI